MVRVRGGQGAAVVAVMVAVGLISGCQAAPAVRSAGDDGAASSAAARPPAGVGHRVVYQFGIRGTLTPASRRKIVITWKDPATGVLRAADTATLGPSLVVGYQIAGESNRATLYANSQTDTADVAISCAVLVDGRVVAFDPGKPAIMATTGDAEQSGIANCAPTP